MTRTVGECNKSPSMIKRSQPLSSTSRIRVYNVCSLMPGRAGGGKVSGIREGGSVNFGVASQCNGNSEEN